MKIAKLNMFEIFTQGFPWLFEKFKWEHHQWVGFHTGQVFKGSKRARNNL